MTTFSEQRLPTTIRAGMRGRSVFMTEILETRGGQETRNSLRPYPRRVWDFDYVQSSSDIDTLYAFFLAMKGPGIGFRFKDYFDYIATTTNGRAGSSAAGTGLPTYQAMKRYTSGALTHDETINKLVSNSATLYRSASPVAYGAGAGQVAVDVDTGIFTFVADASQAIASHTPGASHVFTTAANITQLAIGDKVYIAGTAGTAASTLNGVAHTITNKTGAGPYTWTISTTTTGLTVTTVGTAYAYPQADEPLVWAGEFDRAVRFMSDEFKWQFVVRTSLIELSGVSVIELLS